jgi:hypothetical protein
MQLKSHFAKYQMPLSLQGKNGFGSITAENYEKYLLRYYLFPSSDRFLSSLDNKMRDEYLGVLRQSHVPDSDGQSCTILENRNHDANS